MRDLLQRAYDEAIKLADQGEVADYIPELAKEDKTVAGVSIINKDGEIFEAGDVEKRFSIQSVAKVITYLLVLENIDEEKINKTIGVKPTALPFNSIIDVELGGGKPRNPLVNAGAMAATGLLYEKFKEDTFDVIFNKIKELAGNENIVVSEDIYKSERDSAYNNRAIMNMMVARGILSDELPVDEVANIYFRYCSALVSARDLARISSVLSNDGLDVVTNERKFDESLGRKVRTVMAMGGMYDYSGEFALRVGVPAKSGVGGGIITASKEGLGIATYCPGLDEFGNSLVGVRMLEIISEELNLSIY